MSKRINKCFYMVLLISAVVICLTYIQVYAADIGQTAEGLRVEYLYKDAEHKIPVTDENGIQYLTVTGYIGTKGSVHIPESVKMSDNGVSYTVHTVSPKAFSQNTSVTHISVPDTVTEIGEGAFWGCTSLISAVLPDSITEIPNDCFRNCTILSSVSIPSSVVSIGCNAFEGCVQLHNLYIPQSIKSIGDYAFNACENLILDCSDNSYAMEYASSNNLFTNFNDSPDYPMVKVIVITLILGALVLIADILIRRFRKKH